MATHIGADERVSKKDNVSRLEEEIKNLKAEPDTLKSSLEREGRFEGIKNEKGELGNSNVELKRSNVDLKCQVDKWQSLENKEGTETEKLRKERIALEVKLREVEARLSEKEQRLTEELKVEEGKIERFRARLRDFAVRSAFPYLSPIFRAPNVLFLLGRRSGLEIISHSWRKSARDPHNRLPHSRRRTSS